MPYSVFCNRIANGAPEPHMTWGGQEDDGRAKAIQDALWHAQQSGLVAEVVYVTPQQFLEGPWPIVGQEGGKKDYE